MESESRRREPQLESDGAPRAGRPQRAAVWKWGSSRVARSPTKSERGRAVPRSRQGTSTFRDAGDAKCQGEPSAADARGLLPHPTPRPAWSSHIRNVTGRCDHREAEPSDPPYDGLNLHGKNAARVAVQDLLWSGQRVRSTKLAHTQASDRQRQAHARAAPERGRHPRWSELESLPHPTRILGGTCSGKARFVLSGMRVSASWEGFPHASRSDLS